MYDILLILSNSDISHSLNIIITKKITQVYLSQIQKKINNLYNN